MLKPASQHSLTESEIADIERYEQDEKRMAEEDFGSDLDGILDAYDSDEDWSFESDDNGHALVGL